MRPAVVKKLLYIAGIRLASLSCLLSTLPPYGRNFEVIKQPYSLLVKRHSYVEDCNDISATVSCVFRYRL